MIPHPSMPYPKTQYLLAHDEVHYVGQTIAMVVADSRYIAEDALELIEADFDRCRRSSTSRRRSRTARRGRTRSSRATSAPTSCRWWAILTPRSPRRRSRSRSATSSSAQRGMAMETRGVLAKLRPAHARAHGLGHDAGAAHDQGLARLAVRNPLQQGARRAARHGRRLRHEGHVLSGRGARPVGGDAARPPCQVRRGPRRALRRLDARAQADARDRGGRDARRRRARPPRPLPARHRRLHPVRHRDRAGRFDPASRPIPRAELPRRVHRRLHEHRSSDAVPRLRPPACMLRDRARDGPARTRPRRRPCRDPAAQLHPARRVPVPPRRHPLRRRPAGHARLRRVREAAGHPPRGDRLRRLRRGEGARSCRGTPTSASASRTTSRGRASARTRAPTSRSSRRPARSGSPPASSRSARASRRPSRRSPRRSSGSRRPT